MSKKNIIFINRNIQSIRLLRTEEEARSEFEWINENIYVNREKNKVNIDEYPVCDCYASIYLFIFNLLIRKLKM